MPHYAYLHSEVPCPHCHTTITDTIMFQWGFSCGFGIRNEYVYHLHDQIYWKTCQDGTIPAWVYFENDGQKAGANLGDPSIHHLITRGTFQFELNDPTERKRCPACDIPIEGVAIEIKHNIIMKVWIYTPEELDQSVDYYVVEGNGEIRPMPEWNDHIMIVRNDC